MPDCFISYSSADLAFAQAVHADLSGSGLKNFVKWAFAMDPTSALFGSIQVNGGVIGAHGVPALLEVPDGFGGTNHFALFGRRTDAAAKGLTYAVEFTADLSVWSVSNGEPTVVAQEVGNEIEAVTVQFPALVGGLPPRFFRIRVTAQ